MGIRVVTAPEIYDGNGFRVFLAGGITKCGQWQKQAINWLLKNHKCMAGEEIVLYNPRRPSFDINDPSASRRQIEWEFKYLNKMGLFTMFFYGPTESDQPICFYELGRYIEVIKRNFPMTWQHRIVVTASREFRRWQDVEIQTGLATEGEVKAGILQTNKEALLFHCKAVSKALEVL